MHHYHRRTTGRIAMGGALGFGLPHWLSLPRLVAEEAGKRKSIRACIFVFYYGGPSHLDTYDLKPDGPSTIRGEFQPISTSLPGLQISEHLPHMAKLMDRVTLIRSLHHTNRLHDSASTELLTGRQSPQGDREEFNPIPQFFPSLGASITYSRRDQRLAVSHAALPWAFHNVIDVPCQGGGFLGQQYDPLQIELNSNTGIYSAGALTSPVDLPGERVSKRRELQGLLSKFSYSELNKGFVNLDQSYDRAYQLLSSSEIAKALDLSNEPASMRERYGIESPDARPGTIAAALAVGKHLRAQNLLVARRLVEAGVPFVNVYDYRQQGQNWDAHAQCFDQHKNHLLPLADRSLAALITDLEERGLLESTLVVASGEFGRTPTINGSAGRDHWPDCYSALLAGGGIKRGYIHGASDNLGAYPDRDGVTPADLAATIFSRFGIDHESHIHDTTGRPWRLADGQPIEAIFA